MKKVFLICVTMILLLVGCGKNEENENQVETLVLASFSNDTSLMKQVEAFNQNHTDYKIEIKQYMRSEYVEEDGITQLQREIVSENGPDIINFGYGYSITDIMGEYTENLYPYITKMAGENDTEYFSNILKTFTYQEGLYALPVNFTLKTYAGRSSVIGEQESWSIEELMDCFEREKAKSNGTLMLYPGETKKDVFGSIIIGSIGNYVDWEKGTSTFTDDEFKRIMEFANQFPDTLLISEGFSPMQCFANGETLLCPVSLRNVYDICDAEMILDEEVIYIGYPVNGNNGTVVEPGELTLAISAGSEHKDIAWEFLSQFLTIEYQQDMSNGFPINKTAFVNQLILAQSIEYEMNSDGSQNPVTKSQIRFEGEEPIEIYQITKEQSDILLKLVEEASLGSAYDRTLHMILLEEVDSYFNGDKTVEETAEVMQGRTLAYIGE